MSRVYAICKRHDDEEIVMNGLAVTPAKMQEMAQQGIAISSQNLGMEYFDGGKEIDFEPQPEYRRGMDMASLWEMQQDIKGKMKKNMPRILENLESD